MKTCSKCKVEKSFNEYSKDKRAKSGHLSKCKCCEIKYRKENKEIICIAQKKYREKNKEYFKNYKNEWQKNKLKTDSLLKFKCYTRNNIGNSFKRGKNKFQKNAKTETILGCTIEQFRKYIQSKFTEGMTFENYGKWHLDHIYPVSLAKDNEELIKLNHYTNFQPLWALENIRKGNRLDY